MSQTHGHRKLHILEAQQVTSHGSGAQLEIQLGHICNNRCVFCVSGQLTEQRLARTIDTAPVFSALETARARGAQKVTFLGGEPTLQKSFLPALRHAVDLGYQEIVIFTNGVKTQRRSYVEQIVDLGRFVWRFSIQGGNEQAHDTVTKKPGSFARIIAGMVHLQELGQDITANACINELSYRSLPDFPALVQRHGIRQLHIDMIRPSDAGVRTDEYLQSIMPRYAEMAPYFARMLEGFDAIDPNFDVNIGNYPYCLLPQWAHKIHHDGEKTMTVAADGGNFLSKPWNKYEQKRSDKQHPKQCNACVFRSQCNGIFNKYAQFYGYDEFAPVSAHKLRDVDPSRHAFVLLVEEHLSPLFDRTPPAGWDVLEVHRNTRDRFLQFRYRHQSSNAVVTLVVSPPAGLGEPVDGGQVFATTDQFRLGLRPLPAQLPATAARTLLEWCTDGFAGEQTLQQQPTAQLYAGLIPGPRLQAARSLLRRVVTQVKTRPLGAFRAISAEPLQTWPGTAIALKNPAGDQLVIELTVQPEAGKPVIGIAVRHQNLAPEQVRVCMQAFRQLLSGR